MPVNSPFERQHWWLCRWKIWVWFLWTVLLRGRFSDCAGGRYECDACEQSFWEADLVIVQVEDMSVMPVHSPFERQHWWWCRWKIWVWCLLSVLLKGSFSDCAGGRYECDACEQSFWEAALVIVQVEDMSVMPVNSLLKGSIGDCAGGQMWVVSLWTATFTPHFGRCSRRPM
jgi:hypothetical protein